MHKMLVSGFVCVGLVAGPSLAAVAQDNKPRVHTQGSGGSTSTLGKPPVIFRYQGEDQNLSRPHRQGRYYRRPGPAYRRTLAACREYYGHSSVRLTRSDRGYLCQEVTDN